MKSIVIPDGVESIYSGAFRGCSSLESVVFPDSLTTIVREAFLGCDGLKGAVFPSSLTIIDDSSFSLCYGLQSVFLLGETDIKTESAFPSKPTNVCVPSNYNSTTFCGLKITPDTPVCKAFRNETSHLYNQCFEAAYIDGSIVEFERVNATEWESQTTPCAQYVCFNESGGLYHVECNTSDKNPRMCMNNQCLDNWESSIKGWFVEIGFEVIEEGSLAFQERRIPTFKSVIGVRHGYLQCLGHIIITVTHFFMIRHIIISL